MESLMMGRAVGLLAELLQTSAGFVMKFAGAGPLHHVPVINLRRLGLAGLEVELRGVKGPLDLTPAEIGDAAASLAVLRVAGILDQIVIERFTGEIEVRLVLIPLVRLIGEDHAYPEQRLRSLRAFRLVTDELTIGG